MRFTSSVLTFSLLALTKARLPGPLKICEDQVVGFECPSGQTPFPYIGEVCSNISPGADIPRRGALKDANPCKNANEVKSLFLEAFHKSA